MNAVLNGFWLGVMGERSMDQADDLHYGKNNKYNDDSYNLSGLFRWEKAAIEKYFTNVKSILLLAAGGGRETYALSRMGFEVDSYECNKALVDYGSAFLERKGLKEKIKYLPKNTVPGDVRDYDGIIFGWGAYSHIRGKMKRLEFLDKLRPKLKEGSPLMISFLFTGERTRLDSIVKRVSDFFRIFSRKGKTDTGDWLQAGFVHYFTEEEIKNELIRAGYKVNGFNSVDYGCIIVTI